MKNIVGDTSMLRFVVNLEYMTIVQADVDGLIIHKGNETLIDEQAII